MKRGIALVLLLMALSFYVGAFSGNTQDSPTKELFRSQEAIEKMTQTRAQTREEMKARAIGRYSITPILDGQALALLDTKEGLLTYVAVPPLERFQDQVVNTNLEDIPAELANASGWIQDACFRELARNRQDSLAYMLLHYQRKTRITE